MKKFKKVFAVLLTLAMVLGMSMTSFAANDEIEPISGGKIVVNNLTTQGSQAVTVKAFNVVTFDKKTNDWIISDWAKSAISGLTVNDLDDSSKLAILEAAALKMDDGFLSATTTNGTATIETNVNAGAYLVLAIDGNNNTEYSPMVAVTYGYGSDNLIAAATATVTAKAENYTVTKELKDTDKVVAVGDIIEYEVSVDVPYVTTTTEGDTTTQTPTQFTISDTLVGADFYLTGEGSKATITVGGDDAKDASGTKITIPTPTNVTVNGKEGQKFTVDLSNYLSADNTHAGKKVVITYTAKVKAVDEITNEAESDNAKDPQTGGVKKVTVTAKTGSVAITKYGEEANGQRPRLAGAVFVLKNSEGKYAKIDTNGYITGEWVDSKDNAGTVTTNENGIATVYGLTVGTYTFEETVAPQGYSVNTTEQPTASVTADVLNGSATISDTKLSSLPSTGGIGTTIFTIGGCAIMIIAAALFFASRRKAAK